MTKKRKARKIRYDRLLILLLVLLLLLSSIAYGTFFIFKTIGNLFSKTNEYTTMKIEEPYACLYEENKDPDLDLKLSSEQFFVAEIIDDKLVPLYSRGKFDKIYPASLTKIMTIDVALDYIDDVEEKITVTKKDYEGMIEQEATVLYLSEGDVWKLHTMLYGTVLTSAADCANVLKHYVEAKGYDFIKLMNDKAKKLDMCGSNFTNVTGLHDDENYTTLNDLSKLMFDVWKDERKREYMTLYNAKSEGISFRAYYNDYYDRFHTDTYEVLGGKTGYTSMAGNTFAGFVKTHDNRILIILTANGSSDGYYGSWGFYEDVADILDIVVQ